ncbi:MAG: hypothetical protein AB8B57_17380 [Congregibacter sp.]
MSKDDDLSPIPSLSARREGSAASSAVPRPRGGSRGSANKERDGGGPGALTYMFLVLALLVAIGACVWSWLLQERLVQADFTLDRYEVRIADLEDRLADTDEGMNQNATLQAAKIRELDTEVRKLWDNVWKSAKERLGVLEASAKRADASTKANKGDLDSAQTALAAAGRDIAQLKKVSANMERLMASSRSSQAEVERLADSLNAINLELAKLNKRVGGNEDWISAINAFRQTTNASINQLQSQLRAMQSAPGG